MNHCFSRREFMKTAAIGTITAAAAAAYAGAAPRNAFPRWRGFNLPGHPAEIPEDDFRMIRDLGFDWVRLPENYWNWIDSDCLKTNRMDPGDVLKIKESVIANIDRVIEWGHKYSIHVNLALHRGPGFCISDYFPNVTPKEPFNLFKDKEAEDAFVFHWDYFARRYRGISAKELSFNLLNEPMMPRDRPFMLPGEALVVELQLQARKRPSPEMTREDHRRVMTRTTLKIRETSPDRVVIIDGLDVGRTAVMEMTDGLVGQSVHTYLPTEVSHYRAAWADAMMDFPTPEWPARRRDGKGLISRETLEAVYEPWGQLVKMGVGVHAGESGGYIKTPHAVFLSWMHDVLDILKGYNIGWGLWNFRGNFGVLDSNREDVAYQDWHGHKMDRKLMTLLQYN